MPTWCACGSDTQNLMLLWHKLSEECGFFCSAHLPTLIYWVSHGMTKFHWPFLQERPRPWQRPLFTWAYNIIVQPSSSSSMPLKDSKTTYPSPISQACSPPIERHCHHHTGALIPSRLEWCLPCRTGAIWKGAFSLEAVTKGQTVLLNPSII